MGTGQLIVICVLVVGALFVTVLLVKPELASRIPGLGDLVYYRADFNVHIQQRSAGWISNPVFYDIDVQNISYRKAALSVGAFGFFYTSGKLEVITYKGAVSSHFEDAIVVDSQTLDWESGLFGSDATIPVSTKLGSAGSGTYTVRFRVREYDDWQSINVGGSWPYPTEKTVMLTVPTQ